MSCSPPPFQDGAKVQHCQALKAFLVIVVYQRASQLRNRHFPCPCFNFIYLLLLFPATAWLMGQPGEGACLERLAQALSVGLVFQPPALWDAALFPFYGGGNSDVLTSATQGRVRAVARDGWEGAVRMGRAVGTRGFQASLWSRRSG